MTDQTLIRNFSIIAHIDHGKSTLADRILEITNTVSGREITEQMLDTMDLERERGITIKAQAARVLYKARDGITYMLHLIDTPGHVDFSYEVSRSLAACEGALLVVDAAQGIQAQTLANTYLALDNNLEIVPVLNKIDLPAAEPERVADEVSELFGLDPNEILRVSAKTGVGIEDVLESIVSRIPAPEGDTEAPARALIFDSVYDQYRGVVAYVRVVDGSFHKGDDIVAMVLGTRAEVEEVGFFSPNMTPSDSISAGEVGYIITGIKTVRDLRVGDTLTHVARRAATALPGYREAKPMVFCGLFPIDGDDYPVLRDALDKLKLNDASLSYEPETSRALGFGFRCGFLGLLHMDIVRERLEREYDLDLLATSPNVEYDIGMVDGSELVVHSPADMPDPGNILFVKEPYVRISILVPGDFVGPVMELCQERRGDFEDMQYLSSNRVQIHYQLPLAEIVLDYFDLLKSRTKGYASLDYDMSGYRESKLVKLDILIAGEPVDALSLIVHRDKSYHLGKGIVDRLKKEIPRQLFEVAIQAAIGKKIIARETIPAKRKDVLAKCYGGDISRKRKLLERQKEGKKRMKQVGNVEIPQKAFLAVLDIEKK
ncbi:MAG: translation elongation factor 4 [Thermoleophilia bacterium]|jgi:GTP-binding protein LepA